MRRIPQRRRFAGHGGVAYDSESEARASHELAKHDIVRDTSGFLPVWFHDSGGQQFQAKADFVHPPTGVRFEFKDSFLNGTTTQATAGRQHAASRTRSPAFRDLKFSWSNSAAKLAAVQEGIADAGGALVALFWRDPDAATVARLNKRGTFWTVYGSSSWRNLLGFLKLRAVGVSVSLTYADGAHTFN